MRRSVVEDHFFMRLAALAIHHAPTLADRLSLAAFLEVIAGPETPISNDNLTPLSR